MLKLKNKNPFIIKENIFSSENNKKYPIMFTVWAMIGIVSGVVCETIFSDVYTTISVNYVDYLSNLGLSNTLTIMLNCTAYNAVFILMAMFLGMSVSGTIIIYMIPFVKGLGIGCVCSYIYSAYAIKGVLYCSLIVFPAALIQLIAIILACSESRQMCGDITNLVSKKEKENVKIEIDFYILRYMIIAGLILISALIYSLMTRLFINTIK